MSALVGWPGFSAVRHETKPRRYYVWRWPPVLGEAFVNIAWQFGLLKETNQ